MKKILLLLFIPIISFSQTQIGNTILGSSAVLKFGESVAISSDGNIVVVGVNQAGDLDNGHVRIYEKLNNIWTQIGDNIIGDANFDEAGSNVALSKNGQIVAIGSPLSDPNGSKSGKVKVFKNENNSWVQVGVDINGEARNDKFGSSLDISSDGNIIAIGSPFNSANKGQIRIYKNENNVWTQLGSTIFGSVGGDRIGLSLSLSDDGLTLALHDATGNNSNSKLLRVYKYNNLDWVIKGNLITVNNTNSNTGNISLSANGNIIAYGDSSKHKVLMYEFENNNWVQKGSVSVGGSFGHDTSLSLDGKILVIGSPNVLSAYVYDFTSVLKTRENVKHDISFYPNPTKRIFNIQSLNNLELKEVIIYNVLGKKVLHNKNTSIDISSFPKGVYFAKIITNKGFTTKKIIKN